jgi:hypothetical protein
MSIIDHWPPEATPTPPTEAATAPPELPEPPSWWVTHPCPAWCRGGHSDGDLQGDRIHQSFIYDIALSLAPPVPTILDTYRSELVSVWLEQEWREVEPRVHFAVGERRDTDHQLTLAEARDVFARFAALLTAAGGESR